MYVHMHAHPPPPPNQKQFVFQVQWEREEWDKCFPLSDWNKQIKIIKIKNTTHAHTHTLPIWSRLGKFQPKVLKFY